MTSPTVDQSEIGLVLLEPIDYERRRFYNLNVTAYDASGAYDVMAVHIVVTDDNDNVPQFRGKNYAVAVREDSPLTTTIAQVRKGTSSHSITHSPFPTLQNFNVFCSMLTTTHHLIQNDVFS